MQNNSTSHSMQAKRATRKFASPNIKTVMKDEGLDVYTDKATTHSYDAVYQKLFDQLRGRGSVSILEIGINFGGSILLWQKMIKSGIVVGIDTENKVPAEIAQKLDDSMVRLVFGDAYSLAMINSLQEIASGGFDLIIDDGPHTLQSQCVFAEKYLPLLNNNGLAVIEDIQDESWIEKIASFIPSGMSHEVIDLRATKGRYDDLIMLIKAAR